MQTLARRPGGMRGGWGKKNLNRICVNGLARQHLRGKPRGRRILIASRIPPGLYVRFVWSVVCLVVWVVGCWLFGFRCLGGSGVGLWRPETAPRRPPDGPKQPPRRPRTARRRPRTAPRRPQDGPGRPQDGLQRAPRPPNRPPQSLTGAQGTLKERSGNAVSQARALGEGDNRGRGKVEN